ncbi:uncharacterized protein LOC111039990 [Myzus persicae]|uniref:uncharacterized protein LOC111039990 n=1 Tax=Myzus persicae TaxID=13164 RepID=UPI000B930BB2|nr:uncharacterized protein LOC111039990 [Myzus persicae]
MKFIGFKKPMNIIQNVRCRYHRRQSQRCPANGKIFQEENEILTLLLHTPHDHGKKQLLLIEEFRKTLMNRSKNEQTSHRVIFNEVLGKQQFRNLTVSFKSYKRQMARAKKNNFPSEPRNMEEFHRQLSGTYNVKTLIDGNPFYVGRTSDEISIVFVTPKIKALLRSATDIIMDGTFKAAPKLNGECIQLFVIMGISMDCGFPIVYALMSRKNKEAYINLFKFIKNEVCPSWYPKSITVDFEQASIDAIKRVFPLTNIHGCWFHHAQCVFRNIQKKGLAELFQENLEVRDLVHMLMALPLLPSHKIHEGYDIIKQFYNEDLKVNLNVFQRQQMKTMFRYYKNTWITGNFNTILSVNGRVRRTSNLLEASHRHLMTHINVSNPSPWIFLDRLITYCRGTIHDYLLTENGEEIHDPQAKKWKTQDKKIRTATKKLKEMRFSILDFLKYTKHATPSFGVQRFGEN